MGGAVLNQAYADRIGADRYARDAMETVRYAEEILSAVAASVSVLLSRRAMEYSDEIAGRAVTLELSTSEFFMDNYVEHMMFM